MHNLAVVAQMEECLFCTQVVAGSSPAGGSWSGAQHGDERRPFQNTEIHRDAGRDRHASRSQWYEACLCTGRGRWFTELRTADSRERPAFMAVVAKW